LKCNLTGIGLYRRKMEGLARGLEEAAAEAESRQRSFRAFRLAG